jgi:hypothetical protein
MAGEVMVTFGDIARVCHAANSAWQALTEDEEPSLPWDSAPQWQRKDAIAAVRQVLGGATPTELHDGWCERKRSEGWVYGPVKDDTAMTHPCLVPFDDLPEYQKVKDCLFIAVTLALAGGAAGGSGARLDVPDPAVMPGFQEDGASLNAITGMPGTGCDAGVPGLADWMVCGEPAVAVRAYTCPHGHVKVKANCAAHEPEPGRVGCRECYEDGHECPMTWGDAA